MKIQLLEVENFKRIKKIVISPGNKHLILVGGMNRQGKSSLLGAITAAFGGKGEDPIKPIRDGEDHADVRIELEGDDGEIEYTVHKRFLKSGNTSLKVEGKDGKLSSPQKVLDKVRGERFLDPLRFAKETAKNQRESCLDAVELEIDLAAHDRERKAVFDNRTSANRDVKRYKIELEANPDPGEVPEESTSDLAGKLTELVAAQQERAVQERRLEKLRDDLKEKKFHIERLKKQLEKATDEYEEITEKGKTQKEVVAGMPDVSEELEKTREALDRSAELQAERAEKLAQKERHEQAKKYFEHWTAISAEHTKQLEELDRKKKEALDKAVMPVEGLEIGDDCLLYNGIPLEQASGAEQLRVSLGMAAAMSPRLQDIWVEDGALLDENSLKLVEDFAKEKNLRIWLERVGESDDGALIIEEGSLKV